MKKKLFLVCLCAILVLALAACGGQPATKEAPKPEAKAPAAAKSEPAKEAPKAAAYPTKPVTFICWAKPGGGSDLFTRIVVKALEEQSIGQPLVVDYKAGGAGAAGMAFVNNQPADGYTLLINTSSLVVTPQIEGLKVTYENFDPVANLYIEANSIYAKAGGKFKDIKEMLAFAKANPGKVRVAGSGAGSRDEISVIDLGEQAGGKFTYVPYEGGAEEIVALLGGEVDAMVLNPSEADAQVQAGKIIPLLHFTEERITGKHDAPTAKELGYNIVVSQFRGVIVKKGTPPEIIKFWEDKLEKAIKGKTLQDYGKSNMLITKYMGSKEYGQFIKDQHEIYRKALEKLGMLGKKDGKK